jgi:peptide deformylase
MPLLKILQYGHPLLREKARELKTVGSREKDLFAAMAETMYAAHGIGLDDDDEQGTGGLQVFVNPEIIWESEQDEPFEEGCLSIPGVQKDVYRPEAITVHAYDENFEPFELQADGLLARVIQHELDHLNGIMFVDRLSQLKRALVAGELNKIKSATRAELEQLEEEYPVVLSS